MTLEAWVKPTAPSTNWTAVMIKERPNGLAYGMYATDGAGQPPGAYINSSNTDYDAKGLSGLSLNTWSFLTGTYDEELQVKDVTWISPTGAELTPEQWSDTKARSLGALLDGRAQPTGIRKRGHDVTVLLLLNAYHEPVEFTLPAASGGSAWDRLVDTNEPEAGEAKFAFKKKYLVTGRSLVLFQLRPEKPKKP